MSSSVTLSLVRNLSRLTLDMRKAGADLTACSARLAALHRDVEAFDIPDITGLWHCRNAELAWSEGRYGSVAEAARKAQIALRGTREADLMVDALVWEARALDTLGDWAGLDRVAEQGIGIVESYRDKLSGPYLKAGYMRNRIRLYELGVRAALRRGDLDTLLVRAELAKCRLDQVGRSSEKAEHLLAELRQVSDRISTLEAEGHRPDDLLAKRRGLWDAFLRETSRGAGPVLEGLAQVQARLRPEESILYFFWITRNDLLTLVFNRDEAKAEERRITSDRRMQLDSYVTELARDEPPDDFNINDLDRFSDLWPQAGSRIIDRAERLIISPHRVLHGVPFHAMKVQPDEYAIQKWAIRYMPNASCLLFPSNVDRRRTMVAVGIRDYDLPTQLLPGEAQLASLESAEPEAQDIGTIYDDAGWRTRVVTGPIDEAGFAVAARDAAVLHLACHSKSVNEDLPLESELFLSASRLDGLELAVSGLSAHMVVLSACSSGQRAMSGRKITELPGDDLHGLQAAFISSGARDIVAGLFTVVDGAAPIITSAFHRAWLSGAPADIALAEAVRSYLKKYNFGRRASRHYWAPFFLISVGQDDRNCKGERNDRSSPAFGIGRRE